MTGLSWEKIVAIGLSLSDVNLTAPTVAGAGGRIVRVADLGVEPVRSAAADVTSAEVFARKIHEQLQSEFQREQELADESSAHLASSLSREN